MDHPCLWSPPPAPKLRRLFHSGATHGRRYECSTSPAALGRVLMPLFISAADPRLSYFCPQPVERRDGPLRLERFPPVAYQAVAGQIGPTANLRSSSGCAVLF